MSDVTLRPRSVTELIDATFTLYRRDAGAYIMVTALANLPSLLATILLLGSSGEVDETNPVAAPLYVIVSLVSYALMNGVLIALGSAAYLGEPVDVAAAVRQAIPRLGSIIVAAFARGLLYFIGFLMLIVGAFYFAARTFALEAVIVVEDQGVNAAFERTSALSSGLKWHILLSLFLGYFIYGLVVFAGGFLSVMVGEGYLGLVVTQVVTVIGYPIVGLLTMLLYYDARIRQEGFDVEHLARSLAPAPGASAR